MRPIAELIPENTKMDIEKRKRWEQIFAFGDHQRDTSGMSEENLDKEIYEFRKSRTNSLK